MTATHIAELVYRSIIVGALAGACVWGCPPSWRVRVRRAVPVVAFAAMLALAIGLVRPLPQLEISTTPAIAALDAKLNPGPWMLAVWLAGVAACMARLAVGAHAIRSLLKTTRPVPGRAWRQLLSKCQRTLGLRGTVRLRLAGAGFIPSATGLLRRTVLLPDEALAWTPEQRRLVLLHELGHFRRGDLWTHALGRLVCALHWFNPFAWLLQRQLAVEREFACDELVVSRGAAPADYATLLWKMGSASLRRPAAAAAFLAMASPHGGKLEQRVRRILAPARKSGRLLRLADGLLCATLAALLLFCTACKPVRRALAARAPWTPAEIETRLGANHFPGN